MTPHRMHQAAMGFHTGHHEFTPLEYKPASEDSTEEAVIADIRSRREVGLKKYGVSIDRTDIDRAGWRRHLYEELLDAALYLKREERAKAAPPKTDLAPIETVAATLFLALKEADPTNQALEAYRQATEVIPVTKWSAPGFSPLILRGARSETFEEAVASFGDDQDAHLRGEEANMPRWQFDSLAEWDP